MCAMNIADKLKSLIHFFCVLQGGHMDGLEYVSSLQSVEASWHILV